MEVKNNPKRAYTLISQELLEIPSSEYGLETVLNGASYYSRLRLDKQARPKAVEKLAS